MVELLEQANLVVREADKLRDMLRQLQRLDNDDGDTGQHGDGGDEEIDDEPSPKAQVKLWSEPCLGLNKELIKEKRKNANRYPERWKSLDIIEDPSEGRVLRHSMGKGDTIHPIGYAQPEVVITGAESVHWTYRYNPVINSGRPGKHMSCSLNGGYRGIGYTSHGWVKLGGTANLMHPSKGKENGLRLFVAHRGIDNPHGISYGSGSPKLEENRWYDIEVIAHLKKNKWELLLNGKRIVLTPRLPHLLFDKGQEYHKAHNFIRFMHGGHPPSLKQQWPAEDRWGRVTVAARWAD